MKTFRISILREIRRFGKDRTLLIVTIIIPVMLSLLYVLMFRAGVVESLPIAIVDKDNTNTSSTLVDMVAASPSTMVSSNGGSLEEAQQQMRRGKVGAIVYIPEGLESKVMGAGGAEVAIWIDGTFITKSSLIRRDLTTIMEAFNIGITTQKLVSQGQSQGAAYQQAYPIVLEKHILFNPYGSYAYYLLPGLLPLVLIIMVTLTTAYVVGSEFRYGTADVWLRAAGGNITRAVATKLAPYLLIFMVISLFMNTLLYRFLGLPLNSQSMGLMFLSNVFVILAYQMLAVVFVALTTNMRFALSISAAYTIAAFSFAGLTFPHLAMYKPIAFLANFFPFTFYADLFVEQSIKGAPLARSWYDLAIMGCFIFVGMLFLPMLKRKAAGGSKYYGKL